MTKSITESGRRIRLVILGLLAHIKGFGKTREEMASLVFMADNANATRAGETITGVSYNRISSGELAPPASDDGVFERVFDELADTELTVHPGYAPWLPEIPPDRYRLGLDEYDKGYKAASSLGYSERDVIMGVARRYGELNVAELGAVARETRAYKSSSPGEIKFGRSEDVIARERWANEQPGMAEFKADAFAALAEMDGKEWITDEELMRELGESERGA